MKTKWFAALFLAVPLQSMALNGYFIGNSLTWDMQPDGLAALAQQSGDSLNVGYHIRASQPLVYTANNPDDITFANSYGGYTQALAQNSWDIVTIQPYIGAGSTLATDQAAIRQFVDMTHAGPSTNTKFYVYEGWPNVPSWSWPPLPEDNYQTPWTEAAANDPNQPTLLSAQYFNVLYQNVKTENSGESIYLIPVGDVLARLDAEIRAGHVEGFGSIYDFYRDSTHLSLDVGRFIATVTTYSTLFGKSAVGLDIPEGFFTSDGTATGMPSPLITNIALRDQLEQIAWDVVSQDWRTGVPAEVPVPAAAWLMGSGLLGLGAMARRKLRHAQA